MVTHHTIRPGDTLWMVAAANGVTVNALMRANPWLTDPDHIEPGWVLHVPAPVVEEPPEEEPPGEEPPEEPPANIDASWEAMVAAMTFTPADYIANCDTFAAWYAANTGYDTDGFTTDDLAAGSLDARGQSGTQQSPVVIEGIRGGPARWDGNWITFRHCLIDNWGTYAAYANPTYSNTYGIRFENCTFLADPISERDCALVYSPGGPGDDFGVSFHRCEIAGWSGGLKATGGLHARYVYIHDMYPSSVSGQHVTCSTARRGRHHMIRCMGTDGGSGMFNVYHESDTSDLLFEENVAVGMSPNASSSYAFDNAKGPQGFAAQAQGMVWRRNMVGRFGNPPDPASYAGIQYGPFSSTEGLVNGDGVSPGEYLSEGNVFIDDGTPW